MPIQGIAAANMLVCNSMVQSAQVMHNMPCHEVADSETHHDDQHQNSSKTTCGVLCANLCAITAMSDATQSISIVTLPVLLIFFAPRYTSITLASLQRPPIFLS